MAVTLSLNRFTKSQVPYLKRHHLIVLFDDTTTFLNVRLMG